MFPRRKEPQIERQELHCTNCGRYVQFNMDFALDGNHEISCPRCQHVHYRVVQDGKITEDRWRSSMPSYAAYSYTPTSSSYLVMSASSTNATFLQGLWLGVSGN